MLAALKFFLFLMSDKQPVTIHFFFPSRRRHTRSKRDWSSRRVLFRSAVLAAQPGKIEFTQCAGTALDLPEQPVQEAAPAHSAAACHLRHEAVRRCHPLLDCQDYDKRGLPLAARPSRGIDHGGLGSHSWQSGARGCRDRAPGVQHHSGQSNRTPAAWDGHENALLGIIHQTVQEQCGDAVEDRPRSGFPYRPCCCCCCGPPAWSKRETAGARFALLPPRRRRVRAARARRLLRLQWRVDADGVPPQLPPASATNFTAHLIASYSDGAQVLPVHHATERCGQFARGTPPPRPAVAVARARWA